MTVKLESIRYSKMPVYHSRFTDAPPEICGAPLLPLKTDTRGPAPKALVGQLDIVDEALEYFRANVMFRAFEIDSPADRLLCYLTVYVSECIRVAKAYPTKSEAKKQMFMHVRKGFKIPGEAGFSLGGFFTEPKSRADAEQLRNYLKQCREEVGKRVLELVYTPEGVQDKFWFSFAKKKFMNIETA